jgi:O-antigen/teichoic acid export membrane protein
MVTIRLSTLMPRFLLNWHRTRPTLSRIASNTGWIMADRIVRGAIGVLFGLLIARELGPAAFGQLGFAQALTAITGIFALLGLETVVVREIVRDPRSAGEVLGSAALLRLVGALFGFGAAMAAIHLFHPADTELHLLVAILAAGSLFQVSDVIELYFQANAKFRLASMARLGACLANALLRTGLLLSGASVSAFAWCFTFEIGVGTFLLWRFYRPAAEQRWQVRADRIRKLVRDGWPLAASALIIMAYMRTDQLLLGQMLGTDTLGIYMAAVRLTEMWYVLPIALAAAAFPHIVEARQRSSAEFTSAMYGLYRSLAAAALVLGVVLALGAGPIVSLLYGAQYAESAAVLRIYAWATIPVFMGMASERYLIASGHTGIALMRTLLGFAANIGLNLYLIPRIGAVGAAWATAGAYFVSVFSLAAWPAHRPQLRMMWRALLQRPRHEVSDVAA